MKNRLSLLFLVFMLLVGCDQDDNNDGNAATEREWDVDTECGQSVDTEAWVGPMNLFVWVKNSKDSQCNVSVKHNQANIGPLGTGRIYQPGTNKIYTRVNVPAGATLQIFCTGSEGKRCKFDYGVDQRN